MADSHTRSAAAPAAPSPSFRYDAFISYRHVEPDRGWAKWLHGALETYRVPRELVAKGFPTRLTRIFRDEEELPANADLSTQITTALNESKFLIVICSPRAPASKWVNAEVEHFRKLGRHDKILALLIEGEPRDSFPPSLTAIRREVTDAATGQSREEIEDVEPLAADVRPERSDTKAHTLRSHARLRLMACILGCRFDDLRQRETERSIRRERWKTALIVFVWLAVGLGAILFVSERYRLQEQAADALREHDLDELRAWAIQYDRVWFEYTRRCCVLASLMTDPIASAAELDTDARADDFFREIQKVHLLDDTNNSILDAEKRLLIQSQYDDRYIAPLIERYKALLGDQFYEVPNYADRIPVSQRRDMLLSALAGPPDVTRDSCLMIGSSGLRELHTSLDLGVKERKPLFGGGSGDASLMGIADEVRQLDLSKSGNMDLADVRLELRRAVEPPPYQLMRGFDLRIVPRASEFLLAIAAIYALAALIAGGWYALGIRRRVMVATILGRNA